MASKQNLFRIQNRRLHLTYASHIDPETWLSWFTSHKKQIIEFYSIVHEIGADSYKHTHIIIDAGKNKKFTTSNSRFFDWLDITTGKPIHPNIKPIISSKHWDHAVSYHYKENKPFTNIEKPEDCKETIENIWSCNSVGDALLTTCKTLKEVGGIIAAFNCKPDEFGVEPEVIWNPWQKELYEELKKEPNSRQICWNYDITGGNGKSFFAKHMGMYKGAFVSTKANIYHTATSIEEFIKRNGKTVLIIIFNFSRQQENHNVYQALEELKDGMVTSEKYKGKTIYFNNPHLVVFANYLPEIKHLTIDRWDIRVLHNEKVVKRYLAGQVVHEEKPIDPFISYSLQNLDKQISEIGPPLGKVGSPLNITGASLAPLDVPPSAPLASLYVPPSAPQLPDKIPIPSPTVAKKDNPTSGRWENNRFIALSNPPPDSKNVTVEIDNKKYEGRWMKGIFYPINK